ncbi:reverse transcriptase [Operophtera brumata]|uniref:Reverse transcriptase n=1 Tax=Operophtera brumata TaxID=104452 RepID=A0A0L7LFW3_OPEBR|nr:reverse transcriptase [Operophtera brumata]
MTLNWRCPVYIREKKLRDIMAEFNVSYRKAIIMYVPPHTPVHDEASRSPVRDDRSLRGIPIPICSTPQFFTSTLPVQETPVQETYAQAVSSKSRETMAHKEKKEEEEENTTT